MTSSPTSRKLRIAIVASDYSPTVGGVQTAVRNIAHQCDRIGHTVSILSYQPGDAIPKLEMEEGVLVHRFPWGKRPVLTLPLRAFWTLFRMARVLRNFKPNIVYIHFLSINAMYTLLLQYVFRFRMISSARGNDIQGIPNHSRIQRWMLTRLFRRSKAVLFCSSFVLADAAPYLRSVSPGTIVGVVGDGFNPEEFQDRAAYHHRSPYLLGMGRLVHKKGFDLLIRAFSSIAKDYPSLELLIAGDGEERCGLTQLIAKLGLRDRVTLLGFPERERTVSLLFGCEFFVLSSRIEPFGIVVLEAMASHRVVLATRSGGVVDLVKDRANGLLVEPTSEALAAGMRALLEHPDEVRSMSERAFSTIQDWTWDKVTGQFLDVFERVANDENAPADNIQSIVLGI